MGTARAAHLALAMALALAGGGAPAEVYRWKDSNGRVHFGDRPDATDSQGAKKVPIRRPNLAKGFEASPPSTPAGSGTGHPGGRNAQPEVPAPAAAGPAPQAAPRLGFAAQRQDSCQAKWAAFDASAACFGACGKNTGASGTRNNAGCEHCDERPMPDC